MSSAPFRSGPATAWQSVTGFFARSWRGLQNFVDRGIAGSRGGTGDKTLVHDFKALADAIEYQPVSFSVYSTLYVVVAAMVIAVLWSIFGTVDRIVVAQGKIVTRAPIIVMQPFTTSRILKIHVKAGDRVKKGQSLVTFDPSFAQADESALDQKVRALTAESDRIQAELSGQKTFGGASDADPERRAQAQLFTQRTSQFAAEMAARDSRERQIEGQIDAGEKNIEGLRSQLDLVHKVADVRRDLLAKGAGSVLEALAAERDEGDIDLRLKSATGDYDKLKQQLTETIAERQSFLNQWRSDLNQKLVTAERDAASASEELNKARKMRAFTELLSPVDAVVLEMADRSEGSVLREAETLVTLVPDDAQLDLEANVLSRDVGYIKVGDLVRVKFEAYPFQKFGTLDGRLDVLSPDSLPLKEGDRSDVVFRAEIHLNETVGKAIGQGINVRPGLVATGEIKAGERSIASYILDPIIQVKDESLREP